MEKDFDAKPVTKPSTTLPRQKVSRLAKPGVFRCLLIKSAAIKVIILAYIKKSVSRFNCNALNILSVL